MRVFALSAALITFVCSCGSDDDADDSNSGTSQVEVCQELSAFSAWDSAHLTTVFDRSGNRLPDTDVGSSEVNWDGVVAGTFPELSGVGRYGNCSGALIETGGQGDAPAYVLTNGHCTGTSLMSENGYVVDEVESSTMRLGYAVGSTSSDQTRIRATMIAFASMDKTDVGVVELNAKLAALRAQGFCTYKISPTKPKAGDTVRMAGTPLSGMAASALGVYTSQCSVNEVEDLTEGPYRFSSSFEHGCSSIDGSSGSAIFDSSFAIVGVNNTAVEDGNYADCALSRPCENQPDGSTTVDGQWNYGQHVDFLSGCFDPTTGVFDHEISTCGIAEKFGG